MFPDIINYSLRVLFGVFMDPHLSSGHPLGNALCIVFGYTSVFEFFLIKAIRYLRKKNEYESMWQHNVKYYTDQFGK